MDIASLMRQTIDEMRDIREHFEKAQNAEARKPLYDKFITCVETINKIYKGGEYSEAAKARIKEVLGKAVEEARVLKDALNNSPKASSVGGGSNPEKKADGEKEGFQNALSQAIVKEKPNVKWEDVAGLENAKRALQEAIILPAKFPDIFVGLRKPWKGILMYGPPGTGKTYLAKACATQANSTFFSVSSSDLISKYVGESEKLIKTLFAMAREQKPSIIFVDEIDSLVSARSDNEHEASRRVKTEFLVQMQGVSNSNDMGLLVLGATNLPWALDSAMRRRFEKRIYISLPEPHARLYLLKNAMKKEKHTMTEADFQDMANRTEHFSGSDLNQLIKNACYEPLRKFQVATHFRKTGTTPDGRTRYMACAPSEPGSVKLAKETLKGDEIEKNPICLDDFIMAMRNTKPTVGVGELAKYRQWTEEFGMDG